MVGKFITAISGKKQYKLLSDNDLIAIYIKDGDFEIIGHFFSRYMHKVFGICRFYLKNEDLAKDATMEIFEGLGEKIENYSIYNFKSWLYQVSRNHCLMFLRRSKEFVPITLLENSIKNSVDFPTDFHHNSMTANMEIFVYDYLTRLNEGQRQCIDLMYFKNKSYKQIVESTGYSEKQVKSYIQNGKRNLKLLIESANVKKSSIFSYF